MLAVAGNVVLALVLAIVGAIIAVIVLVQSKFTAFVAWAVLAVALGVVCLSIKVLG